MLGVFVGGCNLLPDGADPIATEAMAAATEALDAAIDAIAVARPENPFDMTGWILAGIAGLAGAGGALYRRYLLDKDPNARKTDSSAD